MARHHSSDESSAVERWQGIGRIAGQLLGGLLVVGAGIAIGLLIGFQSKHLPKVPAQLAAILPSGPGHPAEAPAAVPAKPPAGAVVPATAPVSVPVAAPDPVPAMIGGEEPAHGAEPPQGAAVAPVLFDVADVPSLDLAVLAPAMAVGPAANWLPVAQRPPPPPPSGPLPPWLRNAVAFALPAQRPMIALVFDDLGLDRKRTERAIGLPGPLTLSFLPYAADLQAQTRAARAAGHELLVHMPMEPLAANLDAGPGALLVKLPPDEILRRLDRGLAAFDGYVGINNHMGSRFTSDRAAMAPVLGELQRRGLLFLDSVTAGSTVGSALAATLKLPHAQRNVFLDDDLSPAAVQASLARLEQVARHSGMAVAIGHPHDVTLDAVAAWLPGLAAKGFVLAPVSAVVRARGYPAEALIPAAEPAPGTSRKGQSHG